MILRLVPLPPSATIFFSITFPSAYPTNLPIPAAWQSQISALLHNEDLSLPLPDSIHALDKATWISAVLEKATIDMNTGMVTCSFGDDFDGVEWRIDKTKGERFEKAVESVLECVREAQSVIDKDKESSRAGPVLQAIPPQARILRQQARSTLLDVYRRYVLPRLRARLPANYYTLVVKSKLRRTSPLSTNIMDEDPSMFFDNGDIDTESDDSELHTPSDTPPLLVGTPKKYQTPTCSFAELDAAYQYQTLTRLLTQLESQQREVVEEERRVVTVMENRWVKRALRRRRSPLAGQGDSVDVHQLDADEESEEDGANELCRGRPNRISLLQQVLTRRLPSLGQSLLRYTGDSDDSDSDEEDDGPVVLTYPSDDPFADNRAVKLLSPTERQDYEDWRERESLGISASSVGFGLDWTLPVY
ncbi:hypothetical protein JAAARDRAFT_204348 [Jaapia argillacea MUCL 33604]|uniref:Uncharacterized protein n=1 Tax=Jaapia argillacea MUCL 33604 TaxID=933084 RepID=A0A067Q747_9AGAM|nr:hypothetical protein JAAARDRAFT_204348 [Jaapia argillacea MUCL 33604]